MTRDSASRFYARLVSHTCARHCDIRDYLGLMQVCGRYAGTRALVGSPLLIETVPFYQSSAFQKIIPLINLWFHCLSIIERSASLSLPSISRFFFFSMIRGLEVNLSTKYVYIHSSMCKSDIDCTRIRFPIHFRSKIYIFARYKNSLYPVIWRRRIIFIYIFRHCVHELNMKYRGGGVSRFTILNPSEISKRTKSRDFFRTRRRRYQQNTRLDISKRDSISGVFSYLITRLSRLIIRHPPVSFLSHFTLRYVFRVTARCNAH